MKRLPFLLLALVTLGTVGTVLVSLLRKDAETRGGSVSMDARSDSDPGAVASHARSDLDPARDLVVTKKRRIPNPPTRVFGSSILPREVPAWAQEAIIARMHGNPDGVAKWNYILGLYATLDECAGLSVKAVAPINYAIIWETLDPDGHAYDPSIEIAPGGAEGWTQDEQTTFLTCAQTFLDSNPTTELPRAGSNGGGRIKGIMQTKFPIRDNEIYRFLEKVRLQQHD